MTVDRCGWTSEARLGGEAPRALPVEGVLNPSKRAQASLSGEAGCDPAKQYGAGYPAYAKPVVALPVEGVLNPNLAR